MKWNKNNGFSSYSQEKLDRISSFLIFQVVSKQEPSAGLEATPRPPLQRRTANKRGFVRFGQGSNGCVGMMGCQFYEKS